jgi:hypothetical protein
MRPIWTSHAGRIAEVVPPSSDAPLPDLEQQGFGDAAAALGESSALRLGLRRVAEQAASVDSERRASIQRRIDEISGAIDRLVEAAKAAARAGAGEVARVTRRIEGMHVALADIDKEVTRLRMHPDRVHADFHPVKFALLLSVLLLLTTYLILFYPSVLYTAVFSNLGEDLRRALGDADGMRHLFNGILNPRALEEALESPSALAWVTSFTAVPLAIGVATHAAIDSGWPRTRKVVVLSALLALALAIDSVLAYRIAQRLHEASYMTGGTEKAWTPMAFAGDVNFWLVLLVGFGAYVVWGLVLFFFLEEDRARHPERRAIKELVVESAGIRGELRQANADRVCAETGARNQADEFARAREDLLDRRERAFHDLSIRVVRWSELEARLDDFTRGWVRFLVHFREASTTPAAASAVLAETKVDLRGSYAPVNEEADR